VRKLPKSAIGIDLVVPKNVSDEIHLKTLANLAKQAKVPGFRMARCRRRPSSPGLACRRSRKRRSRISSTSA
jgi:hypothetical protein